MPCGLLGMRNFVEATNFGGGRKYQTAAKTAAAASVPSNEPASHRRRNACRMATALTGVATEALEGTVRFCKKPGVRWDRPAPPGRRDQVSSDRVETSLDIAGRRRRKDGPRTEAAVTRAGPVGGPPVFFRDARLGGAGRLRGRSVRRQENTGTETPRAARPAGSPAIATQARTEPTLTASSASPRGHGTRDGRDLPTHSWTTPWP